LLEGLDGVGNEAEESAVVAAPVVVVVVVLVLVVVVVMMVVVVLVMVSIGMIFGTASSSTFPSAAPIARIENVVLAEIAAGVKIGKVRPAVGVVVTVSVEVVVVMVMVEVVVIAVVTEGTRVALTSAGLGVGTSLLSFDGSGMESGVTTVGTKASSQRGSFSSAGTGTAVTV
jgi:peptidoglycan/LPS O-acetylase OafA/YrhL